MGLESKSTHCPKIVMTRPCSVYMLSYSGGVGGAVIAGGTIWPPAPNALPVILPLYRKDLTTPDLHSSCDLFDPL